jgi:hypothetical protein
MKKWKEKLIRWLGGDISPVEIQPHTIITSTAPLIRLKVSYKTLYDFPEDKAYIKRELAKKLADDIIKNRMAMIDTDENEVTMTLYVADIREVR